MRYEIKGDPISIAYGDSESSGVFLSVYDQRLRYDGNSTSNVNAVTEKIGVHDGGGSYFDLHTGAYGFGIRVDDETMTTYLKRFGVTDDCISALPLKSSFNPHTQLQHHKVGSKRLCNSCRNESKCKDCANCSGVPYCSKSCQKLDWPLHKLFCGLRCKNSPNKDSTTTVEAFLLPERSDKPIIVQLPLTSGNRVDCSGFIKGFTDKLRSDLFTDDSIRSLPHAYHVICKDDANVDGHSRQNKCILNLFTIRSKQQGSPSASLLESFWRGDVLILKAESTSTADSGTYQDIMLADATEAVKFLYTYTAAKGLIS